MNTEPRESSFRVPLRRTRWTSFRVGVVAVIIAFTTAAMSVVAP
ncbi:MAG TPA: hypothetical protein VEZ40_03380 [Pyrinomonadaceae bacterium]|nr:hypothetical protein [Pyrinomonadaceae bacterium]